MLCQMIKKNVLVKQAKENTQKNVLFIRISTWIYFVFFFDIKIDSLFLNN
jgi:hypothetical protein